MKTLYSYLKGSPYEYDPNANNSRRASKIDGVDQRVEEPSRSFIKATFDALFGVQVEEDHSCSLSANFDALTIKDVSPINATGERLLDIVIDHFVIWHIVKVADGKGDHSQCVNDPLKYVENIYDTLVNEVNVRLASLDGSRGSIGVDLEATGGFYSRLERKFPKEGNLAFKRDSFPELANYKEKGMHYLSVNGFYIIEKPQTLSIVDAEWFKRLTGRSEASISTQDYLFYAPKLKHQHIASTNPLPSSSYAKPPIILESPKKPYVVEPYTLEVPNFMVHYINYSYEDVGGGYCGFQAIAEQVGVSNGVRVRQDMFLELSNLSGVYEPVFIGDSVKQVLKALTFSATQEHGFSITDMGHIVATTYKVVFVVLGRHECVTFLPLYDKFLADEKDIGEVCLVYLRQRKGFISVAIDQGFPLPPLHPSWARHHHTSVDELDHRYADRIRKYERFQSYRDPPTSLENCEQRHVS